MNITGGTIGTKIADSEDATKYCYYGSVFGGGKGSTEDLNEISSAGTVEGNVEVNLNKDIAVDKPGGVVHQIFGCNDMNGSPKGTVTVHVYATQTPGKSDISTKPAKNTKTYDVEAVYGGGNLAAYNPTDASSADESKKAAAHATVIIDGCGTTSIKQVYGGGNAASTPATDVTVNGTYEIFELFGGGNGADRLPDGSANPGANVGFYDYHLDEDKEWCDEKEERDPDDSRFSEDFAKYIYGSGVATVNIYGGTVHRVFGGSNTKGNVRKTALTLLEETGGCDFCVDEAYGGGKSAPMDAEAILHMACIPGLKEAYGGAEAADIQDNVTLNITNGTFERIFGGNNISGTIRGAIKVNIEETGCRPIIIGELYGGGNQAGYSVYGYKEVTENGKKVWKPRESATDGDGPATSYYDPQVNIKSFTSIGEVYGGGYGETAVMVGNPTVNINVVADGTTEAQQHSTANYSETKITIDKGLTTEHEVTCPSHTAGNMGAINKVFGGGNAAKVIGNTNVNIGTLDEVVFETKTKEVVVKDNNGNTVYEEDGVTPKKQTVKDTDPVTVFGADIRGNVYGGGNEAEVTGNTNVTIGKKSETSTTSTEGGDSGDSPSGDNSGGDTPTP